MVRGVVEHILEVRAWVTLFQNCSRLSFRPTEESRLSARRADEPVRRLGQRFRPRLEIRPAGPAATGHLQATALTPSFGSFVYDQALSYFERPDRSGIPRALYLRAPRRCFRCRHTDVDTIAPPAASKGRPHTIERGGEASQDATGERRPVSRRSGCGRIKFARVAGVAPDASDSARADGFTTAGNAYRRTFR
jgi:hypothetical protein